jgi:hypothetical protein
MKDQFFAKLEEVVAEAKRLRVYGFGDQEPEEATKQLLLEPLLQALGFTAAFHYVREFKILGDSVDYLLKAERPLIFVEAKSLHDCPNRSLFDKHRQQVLGYIQNYRLSPEITKMEQPVKWIVLTNVAQFHFIRVNEVAPTFRFSLADLWERRELLWELLALENLEADRIDELYDQQLKAELDQQFLADLKRWRLLLANGFAFRNQSRPVGELTLASQQLLDRLIFCRMLETHRLVEYNKLARTFATYEALYGRADKTFAEVLRETLFREIKNDFNTELFTQPLLCDGLGMDNVVLAAVVGHEPLAPELAEQCGFESGQGELLAFRHLYSYDFSRMSQDVMGAVYERFLAHKLFQEGGRIVIEDTDELRKKEGIYYTPRYIVDYIVGHTLGEKIKPVLAEAKSLLGYGNYPAALAKVRELGGMKVLDPAMGSGSFLLRAFDVLMAAYEEYNEECRRHKRAKNGAGTLFDADFVVAEEVLDAPLRVLRENIFGVDLDAQAVEVAKLNLWLRYMAVNRGQFIDQLRRRRRGGQPLNLLPNLTDNLKHGNSLIADAAVAGEAAFVWEKEFPEVMQAGGFDVVVGNPPYIYTRNQGFTVPEKKYFGSVFKHQSIQLNTFGLFIEQSKNLLCDGGALGFITPNNWLTIDTFAPLRKFVLESLGGLKLFNIQERVFDAADVDTAIVLFEKRVPGTVTVGELSNGTHSFVREIELTAIKPPSYIIQISLLKNPVNQGLVEMIEQNGKRLAEYASVSTGLKAYQTGKGKPPQTDEQKENRVFHASKSKGATYGRYLEGEDVKRYELAWSGEYLSYGDWLAEPRRSVPFSGPRLLVRQIPGTPPYLVHAVYTEERCYNDINSMVVFSPIQSVSLKFLLAVLNSRLLSFWFEKTFDKLQRKIFPQFKVEELGSFPIRAMNLDKKTDHARHDQLVELVDRMLTKRQQCADAPRVLRKQILHSMERTPCALAHYLQKDFAAFVKHEILLDDVQRAGFVHALKVESEGKQVTVQATVADETQGGPRPTPILRLEFKDDSLRQFVYACWRHFLDEHARQKKWTKGKKPEPIYPLVVNLLEPLVYFSASAEDNLRTIRELMRAVASEAGSSDLAALETEIARLDGEIDACVYEIYGLTPEEKAIVEGKST